MPKMTVDGIDSMGLLLDRLNEEIRPILSKGLYEANKVLYQGLESSIDALPTNDPSHKEGHHRSLTQAQKDGLKEGMYGSKFQEKNGELYFVIGVTGYNDVRTDKYPTGQPNIMLLRAIENGGSYRSSKNHKEITVMKKRPILRQTLNHCKQEAIDKVQEQINIGVGKLQKENK